MKSHDYEKFYNDYHFKGDTNAALSLYIPLHKRLFQSIKHLDKYCPQKIFSIRCSLFAKYEENIIEYMNNRKPKNKDIIIPTKVKMTKESIKYSNEKSLNEGYLLSMRNITDQYLSDYLEDRSYESVSKNLQYPTLKYVPYKSYDEDEDDVEINVDLRLYKDFIELLDKLTPEIVQEELQHWEIPFDLFLILRFQDQYWEYVRKRFNKEYKKHFIQAKSTISFTELDELVMNTEKALQFEDTASINYLLIEYEYKPLLSDKEYKIVKLTEVGYSAEEIALEIGVSKDSIYVMRNRFRSRLIDYAS